MSNTEFAPSSEPNVEAHEGVPIEPWAYLSPQLQLDVSMIAAALGALLALRVVAGQSARGRRLGARASSVASASFDAVRSAVRARRQRLPQPEPSVPSEES